MHALRGREAVEQDLVLAVRIHHRHFENGVRGRHDIAEQRRPAPGSRRASRRGSLSWRLSADFTWSAATVFSISARSSVASNWSCISLPRLTAEITATMRVASST